MEEINLEDNVEVTIPKPFISIVTICSTEDLKLLKDFLKYLPKSPEVELILLENSKVKDGEKESLSVIQDELRLKFLKWSFEEFSFAQARNIAKSYASGDWIISLDMDEIIPNFLHQEIINYLKTLPKKAKGIKVGMASSGRNYKNGEYDRIHIQAVKIFRNLPKIQWVGHIHELVEWSLKPEEIFTSNFSFYHTGYDLEQSEMINKFYRNIRGIARELYELERDDNEALHDFFLSYMKRTLDAYYDLIKK